MTLSDFLQLLNKHLGYLIEPDETTNRTRNALIVRGFLLNFVSPDAPESTDVKDYNPLNQSDDYLGKIYRGVVQLPYKDANSILNRLDATAFSDFIDFNKTKPSVDVLKALKNDLKSYGKKLNINKYEYDLMIILKEILIDIVENDENSRLKEYAINNLLKEVNFECPLKKNHTKPEPLIQTRKKHVNGKNNMIPNYMPLKIFPSGISDELKSLFNSIKKEPSNLEDDSNILCVCNKCYKKLMLNPTVASYKYLISVKENLSKTRETENETDYVVLEDEINEVLKKLCNISPSDIDIDLRMKPLEIKKKISPSNIDLNKIVQENLDYYYYIQETFSSLDAKNSVFNKIAAEIKLCFIKVESIDKEQNYIFDSLVDWVLEKSELNKSKYRKAAEKIISFFVQNCEVFNEISE